jgi:hypothetical protein
MIRRLPPLEPLRPLWHVPLPVLKGPLEAAADADLSAASSFLGTKVNLEDEG